MTSNEQTLSFQVGGRDDSQIQYDAYFVDSSYDGAIQYATGVVVGKVFDLAT